jgi:GNAT superfamily N-acetyltransferase
MMAIRDFQPEDARACEELLIAVGALSHPEIDGREAMLRVRACPAAVFLVADEDGAPVGLIRGVYDGSRALIHMLAVHPNYQGRGIGTALVREIARRFKAQGAPTLGVTAVERSVGFWEDLTFRPSARYMVAFDIERLTREEPR